MLISLVTARINQLTIMALIDNGVACLRKEWIDILEDLKRM